MQASQLVEILSLFKDCGFKSAKLLSQVILIIINIGQVGLYKIASKLNTKATKHDSKEKSLRRLLDKPIDACIYAKLIDKLFKFSSNCYDFAMDRTNWKLGKTSINLLVLSFNWRGIAIPLYWMHLDNHGGNSNSDERIALISWFLKHYNTNCISNLLADREFPSIDFLRYLLEQNVNFVFRIKDNILATDRIKGKFSKKKLSRLFRDLASGNFKSEAHIRRLLDNRLFVAAKRNSQGELIVLVSNKFNKNPFEIYANRWHIECLFNKTKTKGFNMESSHITQPKRIINLFTIIAIAYGYCCFIGELKHSIKPIKDKYLKNIKCKSKSIFRAGFDLISHTLNLVAYGYKNLFKQLVKVLLAIPLNPISKLYTIMLNF